MAWTYQRTRSTLARRLSRRRFVVGAGLGAAALGLAACGGDSNEDSSGAATTGSGSSPAAGAAKSGGTLAVGLPNEPEYQSLDLNRTTGTWTHLVGLTIFDTMLVEDKDKNLKGSLATSWEEAPDNLSVVLKLRQGVTFHDGTPFNAEAVKFWMTRIADKDNNRALAFSYLGPNYVSTEVIDPSTAKINLKEPNQTMLRRFTRAYFGLTSPAAVEKQGNDDFARNPVGTGPFVFKEWVAKDRVVVAKNAAYNWAPAIFAHSGPPYLDTLTFRVIPDQATRTAALESGDVKAIDEVPPVDVDRFKKDKQFNIVIEEPQGLSWLLRLNTRVPPTNDVRVRQALNYAINKQAIIKTVYYDVHKPASSPLSSSSFGYNPNLQEMYPHDPNRAKQLLDQAGWTAGSGGTRAKDGQELTLSYHTTFRSTAELIQAQLRELGIKVNVELVAPGTPSNQADLEAKDNITDGGTQQAGFLNEDPDILRSTMHPRYAGSQTYASFIGFDDPTLTALMDKQQQFPRNAEREQVLQEIQRLMMENAIVVPIFYGNKALVTAKDVADVKIMPVNFYPFFYDAHLT
ncbi:MAG: ABC transporter substrate-binding protein [Dehalococcoidia bacterium]